MAMTVVRRPDGFPILGDPKRRHSCDQHWLSQVGQRWGWAVKPSGCDYQLQLTQDRDVLKWVAGQDEQVGGEASGELPGGVREPESIGSLNGSHLDDSLGGEVPLREALQRGGEVVEGRHPGVGAGDQADAALSQPAHPPDELLGALGAKAWGHRAPVVAIRDAHRDPGRHDVAGDVLVGLEEPWSGQPAAVLDGIDTGINRSSDAAGPMSVSWCA